MKLNFKVSLLINIGYLLDIFFRYDYTFIIIGGSPFENINFNYKFIEGNQKSYVMIYNAYI